MSQSVQASTICLKSLLATVSKLALGRLVDEIEQAREGIAQIEAAPAAVADVEHAAHLGVEHRLVGEIRIFPIQRTPEGRLETAFPHVAPALSDVLASKPAVERA
ncbi:hypothetical protein [Methylosinus trichosporium]|uniref:hypothetical protein n=1 Tax=Methylosinus trichosporium TaxID=426 RepID=UPI003211EDEA